MIYAIALKRSAEKALDGIVEPHRGRIREAIDGLRTNPRPYGSTRMHGGKPWYRIRAGNYRVRYTVDDAMRVVLVYEIGDRREVYRD